MERRRDLQRRGPTIRCVTVVSGAEDGQRRVQICQQVAVPGELPIASSNQIGDVSFTSQPECGGDASKRDQSFMPAEPGDEASQRTTSGRS